MAEFAAHLNLNLDPERPSFFELVAQDSMMSMLKPALKFALTVLMQRYPAQLAWTIKHNEECYSLLTLLVQSHYLKNYDSSFAENFYGLKRVPLTPAETTELEKLKYHSMSLSKKDQWRSLFFLSILPYIKTKLDAHFAKCNRVSTINSRSSTRLPVISISGQSTESANNNDSSSSSSSSQQRLGTLTKIFIWVYPFVHAGWELSHFIFQMLYLFDYTPCYSPELFLARLRLKRLSATDVLNQQNNLILGELERAKRLVGPGFIRSLLRTLSNGFNSAVDYSKFVLPITIFFFKFLEWWYSSEHYSIAVSLPIPPAPPKPKFPKSAPVKLPNDVSICPLCQKTRVNPTSVSISGIVYCYTCIFPYIEANGKCPVTLLPCSTDQLIRIYSSIS